MIRWDEITKTVHIAGEEVEELNVGAIQDKVVGESIRTQQMRLLKSREGGEE